MLTALDVIKQFANDFREFKSVMLDWAKTLHSEVNEETESFKMTYDISNDSESKSVDGNCSRGRAAVQAGTAIGWPRSVRRMALMARTERRRAVSMTDLMSA